jgi:hypothetical protein
MPSPRVAAAVVLTMVAAVLVVALVRVEHRPGAGPSRVTGSPESAALRVLHAWDERRAAAFGTGSVRRLRELYVPGSQAGAADLRVLRAYRARHLRVSGLRMQVLGLAVLRARPGVLRLRVTDRLVGATAVGVGPRLRLPHDRASTRVVSLMRGADGRWCVATVADVGG